MCGRYSVGLDVETIQERFLTDNEIEFNGTFNAAPKQELPIITRSNANQVELATWGFRPSWAGSRHDGFINARVESADDKPSFADAWQRNRCLVPATGFYEWRGDPGGKTPHYFETDTDLFSFAGLWNTTETGNVTYTILTRPANDDVNEVHGRMPIILHESEEGSWLLNRLGKDRLLDDRPGLSYHQVTKAVNSPDNEGSFLTDEQEGLQGFAS